MKVVCMMARDLAAEARKGRKPPRRNHGWIWFFVILAILSVTASVVVIEIPPVQMLG